MIITKLSGGLGNQMFQYACGRALALRNGDELKLDISGYLAPIGKDTAREYSLSHFNIEEAIVGENEISQARFPYGPVSKYADIFRKKVLRQFNIGFIPAVLNKKTKGKAVHLEGFWQSENYFADRADIIRKDFTLKKPLGPEARALAGRIRASGENGAGPAVSLHIRRGDYVSKYGKIYSGIATPEYYSRALVHIAQGVKNLRVFVFSDNIEWAKKNIAVPYPTTYVSSDAKNVSIPDYEEMALMSMCDHNIIANSSFSWWGAWLNPNPGKIVIAPKQWTMVNDQKWHADTIPKTWIRL